MASRAPRRTKAFCQVLTIFLISAGPCNKNGSSSGGIPIAQNDATAPTLSLGAGQPGGQTYLVSAGGSAQSMNLASKTGPLNLLATADDPESGVQALEIWMTKTVTDCDATGCSSAGPGLLARPKYESSSPKKNPGDNVSQGSTVLQALDLSTEIPQAGVSAGGSRTVQLVFFGRARNHLGVQRETPRLTATWKEP